MPQTDGCRIWSSDWIVDRERPLARIDVAFQSALEAGQDPVKPSEPSDDDIELAEDFDESSSTVADDSALVEGFEPDEENTHGPMVVSVVAISERFARIEDVPYERLTDAIVDMVRTSGRSEQEALTRAVAYKLGFRRTGKKIQERIKWAIRADPQAVARPRRRAMAVDLRMKTRCPSMAPRSVCQSKPSRK